MSVVRAYVRRGGRYIVEITRYVLCGGIEQDGRMEETKTNDQAAQMIKASLVL